jgi:hypothetical protein
MSKVFRVPTAFISNSITGIGYNTGAPLYISLDMIFVILAVSECIELEGDGGRQFFAWTLQYHKF